METNGLAREMANELIEAEQMVYRVISAFSKAVSSNPTATVRDAQNLPFPKRKIAAALKVVMGTAHLRKEKSMEGLTGMLYSVLANYQEIPQCDKEEVMQAEQWSQRVFGQAPPESLQEAMKLVLNSAPPQSSIDKWEQYSNRINDEAGKMQEQLSGYLGPILAGSEKPSEIRLNEDSQIHLVLLLTKVMFPDVWLDLNM